VIDYNRGLEIAMSLQYRVYSMKLQRLENAILPLLVDEVLIAMRLKTYLPDSNFARRVDCDVLDGLSFPLEPWISAVTDLADAVQQLECGMFASISNRTLQLPWRSCCAGSGLERLVVMLFRGSSIVSR